jgi:NAD(P)-dependent dehydrogenase (short-subunit alcohol dehydrogenase family)
LAAAGVGAYYGAKALVHLSRRLDLKDRVVLITGGSRGLGLLLAKEFCERRAQVAVCARDVAELERAKRQMCDDCLPLWTGQCDVTQQSQVEELVGGIRRDLGHIDVLVNNAGTIGVGPVGSMTLADYRKAMDVNFWGAVNTTMEVLPEMRRRREGRIVNITSIGGKVAVPHLLPYVASKFALVGWSEGLRAELQRDHVYVTTAVPGLMRTGSPRNVDVKGQHEKEYAWFSIGDALPVSSMSAARAARRIVQAAVNGEAEVILSIQAKLAARLAGLCPAATAELLALVNRVLPGEVPGTQTRKGYESESEWSPSALTALSDQAARENNEVS